MLNWRKTVGCLAAMAGIAFRLQAQEYEVDGNVELRLHHTDGSVWKDFKGDFKVFVKGCGWLLQINEANDFGMPLRREIGTMNGMELFEMLMPKETNSNSSLSATPIDVGSPATHKSIPQTAFGTSNSIPVGPSDSSFVGHLWLMFASACYFRSAAA